MFILDFGSGNTGKNNFEYMKHMVNCLSEIDPKRKFIIKWQLFKQAGNNIPLDQECFYMIYNYAKELGYKTTASVFDLESLNFLLKFDVPFVKIANRPDLYWLMGEVPRRMNIIVSHAFEEYSHINGFGIFYMVCVSKYPASILDYKPFLPSELMKGISDHTEDWTLYKTFSPNIYECHYKLPDSTGPDAGSFARTPDMLKEIKGDL